jgi:uncharacterized membrane protein YccC
VLFGSVITLALGLLLCYVPSLTTMHAGQVNCLVLLALTLSFYGLSCNRPVLAGVGAAVGGIDLVRDGDDPPGAVLLDEGLEPPPEE